MAAEPRDVRSIGEVLVALKPEFPDVTISKIRFLEAEGLIRPERSPSGYRRFSERDLGRLRRILRLQRDEYLPLRVIRQRLERDGAEAVPEEKPSDEPELLSANGDDLRMTADELAASTGVPTERIAQLASFGLLRPRTVGQEELFDEEDLEVLRVAADFFRYGVEPRHLTMYRHFADREGAFLQAVIMPLMRQRNPEARKAAERSLADLAGISRRLKQALLRSTLRRALRS